MTADSDSPLPNDAASVNPSEPSDGSEGSMLLTDTPQEDPPRSPTTHVDTLSTPLVEPRVEAAEPLLTSDLLPSRPVLFAITLSMAVLSLLINSAILGLASAGILLILSITVIGPTLYDAVANVLSAQQRSLLLATASLILALGMLLRFSEWGLGVSRWAATQVNWEAVGALGDAFGALGQILIAVLAVYIAWRQYVISKDLTIQQNTITQQQTIDSYFQGISDLVLDEEGLLEDWPQERAIAEGRTAAILSSVDAGGKAKIVRFLSQSRLLTPLRRDRRLGRAILDGSGGYQEDRAEGVRVIDLGVMLAGANLSGSDLRWTDLSEVNLIRANLSHCDFVKTNFARTILCDANLTGSDLMGARLYYGSAATATPRTRSDRPNYQTGAFTGAVIENANFSQVARLSDEQRYYCCAWGGSKTRATVPGGCNGIPNLLGR